MEVRLSQLIASALGISENFTLLSVKHTVETMVKALSTKLRIYLSHPITSYRRTGFAPGGGWNYVESFAREMRRASDVVLFEPTTIDELRFNCETVVGAESMIIQRAVNTQLLPRWPKKLSSDERALNGGAAPFRDADNRKIDETLFELDAAEVASNRYVGDEPAHLDSMIQEISRQIGARDRLLINQSDAVVALFPFAEGRISEGMRIEIDYKQTSAKYLPHAFGPAIMVHTPSQERRRLEGAVREFLPELFQPMNPLLGLDEVAANVADALSVDASSAEIEVEFGKRITKLVSDSGYVPVFLSRGAGGISALSSDSPGFGELGNFEEELAEQLRRIAAGDTWTMKGNLSNFDRVTRFGDGWFTLTVGDDLEEASGDATRVLTLIRDAVSALENAPSVGAVPAS